MRVIAGSHRGRRLFALAGRSIRPTADRLRESLFNILHPRPAGMSVLDLFAGTGALGIEALSRGAVAATFVDHAREAVAVIERNLAQLGLAHAARVMRWDIARNLHCLRSPPDRFDLVFMDPPYGRGLVQPALRHLADSGCLASAALLLIEHDAGEPVMATEFGLRLIELRRYGKTVVTFLESMI